MTSHYINDTDHTLQHKLQQLKDQLPNLESHSEEYKQWWQNDIRKTIQSALGSVMDSSDRPRHEGS